MVKMPRELDFPVGELRRETQDLSEAVYTNIAIGFLTSGITDVLSKRNKEFSGGLR